MVGCRSPSPLAKFKSRLHQVIMDCVNCLDLEHVQFDTGAITDGLFLTREELTHSARSRSRTRWESSGLYVAVLLASRLPTFQKLSGSST